MTEVSVAAFVAYLKAKCCQQRQPRGCAGAFLGCEELLREILMLGPISAWVATDRTYLYVRPDVQARLCELMPELTDGQSRRLAQALSLLGQWQGPFADDIRRGWVDSVQLALVGADPEQRDLLPVKRALQDFWPDDWQTREFESGDLNRLAERLGMQPRWCSDAIRGVRTGRRRCPEGE